MFEFIFTVGCLGGGFLLFLGIAKLILIALGDERHNALRW